MTALSKGRRTPHLNSTGPTPDMASYPLAAVKSYNGSLIVRNSSGYATPCTTATGLVALGVQEEASFGAIPGAFVDNSAGNAGDVSVNVRRGIFLFTNYGSDPLDNTMIGQSVFGVDDQTVAATNGGGTRSAVGLLWKVVTGSEKGENHGAGAWVIVGLGLGVGAAGVAGAIGHASNAGVMPAFAAADSAPLAAAVIDGAVFSIPTTAANSTVTLPTASMPATPVVVYFNADGTHNGHTVTYRVGTTALTAAATASKTHTAIAVWSGTNWSVSLSVGP